jgi:8-oxo-dGTP pyrophosphatase MutT (NUDIX family)
MNRRLPIQEAVSAGGVVWRRGEGERIEVVICGRRSERVWGLPKGTPDDGEKIEQTALREVREETGLEVRLGERLNSIEYWFTANGVRYHKRVHHWMMEPVGGDLAHHDHEFDDVRWLPAAEAHKLLTYDGEKKLIAEAARKLGAPIEP